MSQKSKPRTPASSRPADPEAARRVRRVVGQGLLVIVLLGGGVLGLSRLKQHVERDIAFPTAPLIVVVKNRPRWMTDDVVRQVVSAARPVGAHSAFDRQMLVDVRHALEANPWVERVNQVRRAYTCAPADTLEIDCVYRVPAALVQWGQYYWLVDRKGIKLPEQFLSSRMRNEVLAADGRVNLRIINGVRKPPPEAGNPWQGEDLAAGLEMAAVLFNRPFTEEIIKIDVSNFNGREHADAAHVALVTKYGTTILWGRPPSDADAFIEIRPDKKLDVLRDIYAKFGRVDMRQPWIDVRFDGVRYAAPPEPATARLDLRR